MLTDDNQMDCDHFTMHTSMKSCCIPETNTLLVTEYLPYQMLRCKMKCYIINTWQWHKNSQINEWNRMCSNHSLVYKNISRNMND